MQANKIQEGAKDLIEKLINLDPIEAHSAINQYFDTHAILQSREVSIQGADRIKKQFDLVNHVFKNSELVGQPKWSEEQQTITFTYKRQIECPELFWPLNSLPIVNKLSRASKTIHFDGSLHLNPDGRPIAGDPHQLLVTKYDVERRERAPLENLVPYYVLRPFFSLVSNLIASVAAIVLAYPFTPTGIVHMVTSLINNFWLWFYDKVADRVEGTLPSKPVWTEGAGSDLPIGDQLNSLLASAEDQAKKLGLPVERAKELAQEAYNNAGHAFGNASERVQQAQQIARQKVQEAARYAQDTSKKVQDNAPKNADEAKGKAEKASKQAKDKAGETTRDAKKKAGETANDASGKAGKKASEARNKAEGAAKETQGNVQAATNNAFDNDNAKQGSTNNDSAGGDDLPTTPLGGTDPLAPGAPSYAGAAAEE